MDIINSAEVKRLEIINSKKYLSDENGYYHHPKSYFTSCSLNEIIEQVNELRIFIEKRLP
ncbi:13771_t:CDS:2 [Entrophospora sp. SA101]|nr:13771_t:CDS:2 [Entrophospora sp. SA101]